MVVSQKIKNSITLWHSNFTSGHISKRIESRVSKRYLHTHVQSSMIYNSQKVEATHMFIEGWINTVWQILNNRILFSLKERRKFYRCYMDEPWGHWLKYVNTVWFHLYEVLRVVKTIQTRSRMVVARSWWGEENGEILLNGWSFRFKRWKERGQWLVVLATQQCKCIHLFFNPSIVALQYCVSFCYTTMWIKYIYIYIYI